MNILVLATAAVEGGAVTVLNNLYNEVVNSDDKNNWFFTVSYSNLSETNNIKILDYSITKKSPLHRLYFDRFTVNKLIKDNNIDVVISLQNTLPNNKNVIKILYSQQSLPFAKKRFKFSENKKFWIYQNIISKFIYKGIKRSDLTIVQSNWMKDAIVEKVNINSDKVVVNNPQLDTTKLKRNTLESTNTFFYPAFPFAYKNHQMIIDGFKNINDDYSIVFTIDDKDDYAQTLITYSNEHNVHVDYIGIIPYSKVSDYYSKSVLIFASEIETFGLPLLEARLSNAIVLALSTPFSHEILDGYQNAYFFNNPNELNTLIKRILNKDIINIQVDDIHTSTNDSLYTTIANYVSSMK